LILLTAAAWMNYLGHFHPVIVHLPIGILFVTFILELVAWKTRQPALLKSAIDISLVAGFASTVIACLFGWFLGREGGYEPSTLDWHQWMGISVALITGIAWAIRKQPGFLKNVSKAYRYLLIALFLLLMITGHLGGNMTHGEDYLTAGMPDPFAKWFGIEKEKDTTASRKPITDIQEAFVYTDLVVPILSDKCYSCHSSKKVKGALRMDTEPLLFKGGKHGEIIQPGNGLESELVKRLLLPAEDDKRMPPKDQPQLTKEEMELLRWWIDAGADTRKKIKELRPDSTVLAAFTGSRPVQSGPQDSLSKVFRENPAAPDPKIIDELLGRGIIVRPVAQDKHLLEISCINYPAFDNAMAGKLIQLADHIVWLRADNTSITDEALTAIGKLKNLVRLNLSGTGITSAGIARLKDLQNLEYINIVNTKADDAGLLILSEIPSLRNIYCWNSMITASGIEKYKIKMPAVHVESGNKQ
jgi:uncharacterized membrane protein